MQRHDVNVVPVFEAGLNLAAGVDAQLTMAMNSPTVVTQERHSDGVLLVTMDDGRANAVSHALIAELSAIVDEANRDETVRALVIAGRPGRFSAGFDLSVINSGDAGAVAELVAAGGQLMHDIYASSVPVVAACTGHAVAAGALLILACDYRVGPDADIKIGLNESAIGMALPGWAVALAADRLSRRHLQHCAALAALCDGRGAVDAGFLDVAVEPVRVLEVAMDEAARVARFDRKAYATTARRLRRTTLDAMAADVDLSD